VYYLFTRYNPVNSTITSRDLDTLTGLLCYYTAGLIPIAGSYEGAARYDLAWWKAIVYAVYQHPEAFSANISSYDVARSPTWFICTDASTTIGGGGWLSTTPHPQH
jgi:hypothetical protein